MEFVSRGKVGIRDLGPPPRLKSTEILLETAYTGITNGTERHAFLSEQGYSQGRFPCQHGYQHVSKVVAISQDVAHFEVDNWVFYGAYVGHNGWNVADQNSLLVKLPAGIDRKFCALFGVAGVALRSVRRMNVSHGDNVFVAGQGPIGYFVAQMARVAGAKVTVTDQLQNRLDTAKNNGIHITLNIDDKETEARLIEGGPYNYVFDCCSAGELLSDLYQNRMLAYGGTVAMMAVRDMVSYPWGLLHGVEARIETSCHFDADDLRVLLFLYQQELVKTSSMVSHTVSIDEAARIYQMLAEGNPDLFGVIFDWS
ncbi:MAG: zinc-binding dehydrogenase, partial [Candidatus Poribacteria bacterium]|nr:zinc-binding dehydrogenase [Candidatus Poribacteria bacterium]